jgi:hypothetical protein
MASSLKFKDLQADCDRGATPPDNLPERRYFHG